LKAAEPDPAAIVTDPGAVNWLFDVESNTFTAPVGTLLLKVTVQLLTADGVTTAGLQTNDDTTGGDTRAIVALAELPL
jgi:hypothetical protein